MGTNGTSGAKDRNFFHNTALLNWGSPITIERSGTSAKA
ncbi:hypothetical protein CWATWH0401_1542 [Crocosphaera watsonii WH 0401]|uniref:Uncharacterized protein n=1 Tax=Crocosphaera watsonii WH 0401 TaxID=555881 RepID=T2J846_CROWT|nr:hypothetical protein CWATWH0401_1542 [Crocosphaera watsonii WH 0401]